MSKIVADVIIQTIQAAGVKRCYGSVFMDKYVAMHEKTRKAAHAETTKPPRSPIHGTYLTHLINRYAKEDALFASDDGTALVWTLRHIDTNGKRRTFASLH